MRIFLFICAMLYMAMAHCQLSFSPLGNYLSSLFPVTMTQNTAGTVYTLWHHPQFQSGIMRTPDMGSTWTNLHPSGMGFDYTVRLVAAGNRLILLSDSMRYTTDEGQNWTTCGSGITTGLAAEVIAVRADQTIFVASRQTASQQPPLLFKSTDLGSSFTAVSSTGLPSNFEVPSDLAEVSGVLLMSLHDLNTSTGAIYTSSDNGVTWSPVSFPSVPVSFYSSAKFTRDQTGKVYVAGIDNASFSIRIFRSSDQGSTWNEMSVNGLSGTVLKCFFKSSGPFFLGIDNNATGSMFAASDVTGLPELHSKSARFYPNPCRGTLRLEGGVKLLEVHDLFGKLIKREAYPQDNINLSELCDGLYSIRVTDNHGNTSTIPLIMRKG